MVKLGSFQVRLEGLVTVAQKKLHCGSRRLKLRAEVVWEQLSSGSQGQSVVVPTLLLVR